MGASNNAQPIQSQTAPPAAIAPSGGGGCGHGGGQMAPPPVSQPPVAQASQPPQQSNMPSWFTGNSGGTPAIGQPSFGGTPAISQPGIGGTFNGGNLPIQPAVLNQSPMDNAAATAGNPGSGAGISQGQMPASWMEMIQGGPRQANINDSVGPNRGFEFPLSKSAVMSPSDMANGATQTGRVLPQTLFSM